MAVSQGGAADRGRRLRHARRVRRAFATRQSRRLAAHLRASTQVRHHNKAAEILLTKISSSQPMGIRLTAQHWGPIKMRGLGP